MKKKLFTVVYFLPIFIFSQKITDTSFLLREFIDNRDYHAIYIDYKKTNILLNSGILNIKSEQINEELKEIKDSFKIKLNHFPINKLGATWLELKKFKDKYYLYYPSDEGEYKKIRITDSAIMELKFDPGIVVSALLNVNKSQSISKIKYVNKLEGEVNLKIHFLNNQQNIAVFEWPQRIISERYCLMVRGDKSVDFSIIINYCQEQRTNEFKFHKINYRKLLASKKVIFN